MASSSSASNSKYYPRWKYVVFLSFRGEDTRKTFTGHLYEGLRNRGINTFQDDKRLEHGDSIPKELLRAIEDSQVALIIFSKNYATSRWCLNELVKIMECKEEENGQTVIPIFYNVDPSHVRYQSESFGAAFAKHELKYKDDVEGMQKVQRWRTALTAAANLKGYDIRNGIESENIQQIVDCISSKFCTNAYSLSFLQDIVGINAHLEKLKSKLQIEINDVRILGIWGIGGVGKTRIAKAIFDTISYQFEASCFLADVKEFAKKNKLHFLQNILLSELLRKKNDYVYNKYDGKCMIPNRLCSLKVLIVLDDIDHGDQMEYLAGDVCWFGNGSRVIVTTRNKHLIEKDDAIYEVSTLPDHEAMQLFNMHAFKKEVPNEDFKELALEIVNHAKGLPLALKVWGCLLHKKNLSLWKITVEQIKKYSNKEIVKQLKISYDGLESEEQEIFLDIACFFRGEKRKEVMQILKSCDFGAEYGLDVLINKSLVFISENDRIEMHDLIRDMGRYVVKMQKLQKKRSRIWDVEDFKKVMIDYTGTMTVEAIWFSCFEELCFNNEAMKKMKRLRILHIFDGFVKFFSSPPSSNSNDSEEEDDSYDLVVDHNDDSIEYLSNNLRWLVWNHYSWKSLPENFKPEKLVHLELRWSSLHYLWKKTEHLPSLRKLDLSLSKSLVQTPDFTGMPNLEYLNLEYCSKLEEVHYSLAYCEKLIELNLSWCTKLRRFPYINMESLESLDLQYCYGIMVFPEIIGTMKPELMILSANTMITELPSSLQYPTHLTELDLSCMENLEALPSSIVKLKDLVKLNVSYCLTLKSLPEEIGDLENLEELDASRTLISQPPSSIVRLNKLKSLKLMKRNTLLDDVCFVFPPVNNGLLSLEILELGSSNFIDGRIPEDIGCLSSLKELRLEGDNFNHLPQSIAQLGALRFLYIKDCRSLTRLPEFPPQLDTIFADWSNDLICKSLFQNISSFQHNISASDSLSLRVFTSLGSNIPSWFHHQGTDTSVSVNLPENWYVSDNFLGFAVCYYGNLIENTAELIMSSEGMPCITWKVLLSNHSECTYIRIHFFLVPFAGLWDTSNANGKTPNDYKHIMLSFPPESKECGVRLFYEDESLLETTNDELTIGVRRIRYDDDDSEHYEEASCSSSKKQRS
ncbi:TMV resistance protein N-like isoform X1 [Solanum pennellii]|uniref:ADP-ribosyl cyclase/cyclic ADP-ribose hydrolase n=2 Tax=Solanum pennellii TaxID=28526 RepID=A0ABM1GVQ1_SOLPN|nr:TMV resistance protein N-like isoform X1 [Solanum pennellii]